MKIELLQPGTKAPELNLQDQDGKTHKLSQYKGHKLILYFYPKDDTPGCTKEACNLRDNYALLQEKGFRIIGVSMDDAQAHAKFTKKYALPFPLLCDTDQKLVKAYGVWGEKSMYGRIYMGIHRVTYVVDEKGYISHVFSKVDTGNHAEQILKAMQNS